MIEDAAPVAPRPEALRLRQLLGVGFGVAVAVGSMIGAGILRAPAEVASQLPTPLLFLGVWVIGGAYALLGANVMSELAAMIPRSGGQLVYARRAYGPFAGFLVGWNDWLSTCASNAAVAIVVAESIRTLVPGAPRTGIVATMIVSLVTVVVWRGVREGDVTQRATSLVKAAVLVGLVALCLAYVLRNGPATADAGQTLARPAGIALVGALVVALQGVIFAFDGWTGIVYFAEEVRDPGRDIPRSLFGGLLAVLALYLLINAAFLGVLPLAELARSPLAAAAVADRVVGGWGGTTVNLLVMLALPSSIVANLLMASRSSFALARDGVAPRWMTRVNAGGTPSVALLASAVASAVFLLTGTFGRVIAICTFLFVATYALSFTALFVLRRREPDTPRPYRAWGHPWTTALAIAGSLAFLAGVVAMDRTNGLIALALVVASWPVWRIVRRG